MALQQQKTVDLGGDVVDRPKRSTEPSAPDAKPPQNKSQALIAEFQQRLQHTLDAFKQKAAVQIAEELPKAAEGIVKRSLKDFQKLREDLKTAGAGVADETQRQFSELARASLDSFTEQAKSTAEAARKEMAASYQEQSQTVARDADAALRSVHEAAGRARSGLQEAAEQAQAALIEQHQKQVAVLSVSGVKDLERKAERCIEAFEARLESTLNTFKRQATDRLETELSKTIAHLVERSAGGLQKQVDGETERLLEKLRTSGAGLIEDTKQRLAAVEQASIESVNQTVQTAAEKATSQAVKEVEEQARAVMAGNTETAVARVEAAGNRLQTQTEQTVEEYRKRLAELSMQTLENSWHKLDAQHQAFSEQLQNSVREIEEKALQQTRQNFAVFTAQLLEQNSQELSRQTAVATEDIKDKIKLSVSNLAEEARKQLLAEAQWSMHSLKEATAEQCQAQLNQIGKDFGTNSRKKLNAELEDSIRKYRKLAQSQLDELSRVSMERTGQAYIQAGPAPVRSSIGGKVALAFAAIAPTLLFLYFVSRPVMKLRPEPPADFLAVSTEWGARRHNAADKLARAYWDWAALHLVPQYPYGTKLPEQPPLGFDVEGKDFPSGVDSDLTRLSYWNELRKLWVQPQSWTKIEVWDRE